jgi:hypothetical protein
MALLPRILLELPQILLSWSSSGISPFIFSLHYTSHIIAGSHYAASPPCPSLAYGAPQSLFFSDPSVHLLVSHLSRSFDFPPPAPGLEGFYSFLICLFNGPCFWSVEGHCRYECFHVLFPCFQSYALRAEWRPFSHECFWACAIWSLMSDMLLVVFYLFELIPPNHFICYFFVFVHELWVKRE